MVLSSPYLRLEVKFVFNVWKRYTGSCLNMHGNEKTGFFYYEKTGLDYNFFARSMTFFEKLMTLWSYS